MKTRSLCPAAVAMLMLALLSATAPPPRCLHMAAHGARIGAAARAIPEHGGEDAYGMRLKPFASVPVGDTLGAGSGNTESRASGADGNFADTVHHQQHTWRRTLHQYTTRNTISRTSSSRSYINRAAVPRGGYPNRVVPIDPGYNRYPYYPGAGGGGIYNPYMNGYNGYGMGGGFGMPYPMAYPSNYYPQSVSSSSITVVSPPAPSPPAPPNVGFNYIANGLCRDDADKAIALQSGNDFANGTATPTSQMGSWCDTSGRECESRCAVNGQCTAISFRGARSSVPADDPYCGTQSLCVEFYFGSPATWTTRNFQQYVCYSKTVSA